VDRRASFEKEIIEALRACSPDGVRAGAPRPHGELVIAVDGKISDVDEPDPGGPGGRRGGAHRYVGEADRVDGLEDVLPPRIDEAAA
jgi:hypothetical protein